MGETRKREVFELVAFVSSESETEIPILDSTDAIRIPVKDAAQQCALHATILHAVKRDVSG